MTVIAVDDESRALKLLLSTLAEVLPGEEILGFQNSSDALLFAGDNTCDIAFLDIRMREMSGLELAKRLKELHPCVNIIFVTGYSEYAMDAFSLYVSGYLLKPVDAEGVQQALDNLRHPLLPRRRNRLYLQCFGNFDVFCDGLPLSFSRAKTKELLAYLTDRAGATCTTGELIAVLWEDAPAGLSQSSNLRNLVSDLKSTLASVGAEDALIKGRGTLALNCEKVDCDYFDFLHHVPSAVNSYRGEYMSQYSWSELTTASLSFL